MTTAQQFVDALNHKYMPQFGYQWIDGQWLRAVYDMRKYDSEDFDGIKKTPEAIQRQRQRLQCNCWQTPKGETVRILFGV